MFHNTKRGLRLFSICMLASALVGLTACGDDGGTADDSNSSTNGGTTSTNSGTTSTNGSTTGTTSTNGGTTSTNGGTTSTNSGTTSTNSGTTGTTGGNNDPVQACLATCNTLGAECESAFAEVCPAEEVARVPEACSAACDSEDGRAQIAAAANLSCDVVVPLAINGFGLDCGGEPTLCEEYCGLMADNCTGDNEVFADMEACMAACEGYADDGNDGDTGGDTVQCRIYHAGVAADAPAVHCPHASEDGGGVCVDEIGDCEADAVEPNNTPEEATPADPADSPWEGLTICEEDEDWFAITVPADVVADIEISFTHDDGDLDLLIFDPLTVEDGPLAASDSTDDNEGFSINPDTEEREFLLLVVGYEGATNTYDLSVAYNAVECETDDECGELEICQDFQCEAVECLGNGDCEAGEFCDFDNTCAALPDTCVTNGDCPDGFLCEADACVEFVCAADEYEPNDTAEEATAADLADSPWEGLTICGGESDWYTFTLAAGERARVDILFADAVGDIDAELYDAADLENTIAVSGSASDNESFDIAPVDADTTFMLHVFGFTENTSNTYDLAIEATVVECTDNDGCEAGQFCDADFTCVDLPGCDTTADCPAGFVCEANACVEFECADDIYEPNDTAEEATAADPADSPWEGLSICGGDTDWFAFSLAAGESAIINLYFEHAAGDIDTRLFDAADTDTAINGAASSDDNETIVIQAADVDTDYLLQVFGFQGAENVYDLEIVINPEGICTEDADCAEGDICRAEQCVTPECTEDADCDGIAVCSEGACFEVECVEDTDCGELQVCTVDFFGPFCEDVECIVDADCDEGSACLGNACQVIECTEDADCGDQDCFFFSCSEGCTLDAAEPNDTYETATDIDGNLSPADTYNSCGSWDIYSFAVAAGDVVTIDVFFTNDDGDIDAYLFDATTAFTDYIEEQPLNDLENGEGISADDNEQIVYTADADGEYHLLIQGFQGAINDYTFSVTIE